jgi:hypothetical protein
LPKHNSSTDLPSELLPKLLSTPLVWLRQGGFLPPLQPLYDGPYVVLRGGPHSLTIRFRSRDEVVPVSRLKACTGDSRCHAWQPVTPRQTAGFMPRRSSRNQAGLVFRPAGFFTFFFPGATKRRSWTRFLTRLGGFCMPWTGGAFTASTDTVPLPTTGTATEVGPLTSSPPSRGQSSGEPCGELPTPWGQPNQFDVP